MYFYDFSTSIWVQALVSAKAEWPNTPSFMDPRVRYSFIKIKDQGCA